MVRAQGAALFFAVVIAGALSAACGASGSGGTRTPATSTMITSADSSPASADSAEIRDVHAIHRSRCGNCHVRVEPGTHTRAELETAFARHHTRVKMSDAEWSKMVDFLAADGSANAHADAISTSN